MEKKIRKEVAKKSWIMKQVDKVKKAMPTTNTNVDKLDTEQNRDRYGRDKKPKVKKPSDNEANNAYQKYRKNRKNKPSGKR